MTKPMTEYFAVSFVSKTEAAAFELQASNACGGPVGIQMAIGASRPVVLMSLRPGVGIGAYISAGAVKLLALEGARYAIATVPTPLASLPGGLALLAGDQADYTAYLNRR